MDFVVFQEIPGNRDRDTAEGRILNPPIIARYIRINPKAWNGHIAMRVELFGCREGVLSIMIYVSHHGVRLSNLSVQALMLISSFHLKSFVSIIWKKGGLISCRLVARELWSIRVCTKRRNIQRNGCT